MRFTTSLLVAASFISAAFGCLPARDESNTGEYPYPTIGSDEASNPATTGYFINHFSLNVKNLTRSLDFYNQVFGMRHMFTLRASEHSSIAYMAHSQAGRNGTGYQTAAEMIRDKNNMAGLVELIHMDIPGLDIPASTEKSNTFGHIGMVVPDIKATQERLESFGVTVYKNAGDILPEEGPLVRAFAVQQMEEVYPEEYEAVLAVLNEVSKPLIFASDPDGNLIEIQVRDGPSIV